MLESSDALRGAYATLLAGVNIGGVIIPSFDERVNGPTATIMYGSTPVECYIILRDQTETDISPKCNFETENAIQVDINTKFPKGTGGKYLSEQISNQVKQLIYPSPNIELPMGSDFQCYGTRLNMSKGLIEYDTATDNYRKILLFIHRVNQLTT